MAEHAAIGAQRRTSVSGKLDGDDGLGRRGRRHLVEVVRHRRCGSLAGMSYQIRTFGDPVLKSKAAPVADIDGKVARLVDDMFDTLHESDNGLALAAPQIGVQKQIFVWDIDDDPMAIINPEIVESSGEWVYDEGCLSIPGLYVEMVRPKQVLIRGVDVDGNAIESEADELEARMFQHELDHLNGVLMFDRMTAEQRRDAMAEYRRLQEAPAASRPRRADAAPALTRGRPCGWSTSARPRWQCRRCGRWSPPGTTSRWWSPASTGAGAGGAPRRRVRSRQRRLELGLPVVARVDDVLDAGAELGVVVAFGRLIKPHVLAALPMINLHFSLLPRWRGAAPVERALLAGDEVTGVCVMERRRDARHRRGVRPPGGADRPDDDGRRAAGRAGRRRHRAARRRCWPDRCPSRCRRSVSRRTPPRSIPPSCSIDWRAARRADRPVGAGRRRVDDVPRQAAEGARRRGRATGGDPVCWSTARARSVPATGSLRLSRAARGRAPMAWPTSPTARSRAGERSVSFQPMSERPCHPAAIGEPPVGRLSVAQPRCTNERDRLQAKVLTVSDGVVHGTRDDASGRALVEQLDRGRVRRRRAPGDAGRCRRGGRAPSTELTDGFAGLVVTTGGTGFAPRDQTPEGTRQVIEREAPGLAEAMRLVSPLGRLSRGIVGDPRPGDHLQHAGSPKGCVEQLGAILDVLPHALRLLARDPDRALTTDWVCVTAVASTSSTAYAVTQTAVTSGRRGRHVAGCWRRARANIVVTTPRKTTQRPSSTASTSTVASGHRMHSTPATAAEHAGDQPQPPRRQGAVHPHGQPRLGHTRRRGSPMPTVTASAHSVTSGPGEGDHADDDPDHGQHVRRPPHPVTLGLDERVDRRRGTGRRRSAGRA